MTEHSSHRRNNSDDPDPAYRSGVGMVIFNPQGLVLVAERLSHPGAWQLPQGGIDEGESPEAAVFREMEEEIGTRNAEIIGVMEEWITYDLPQAVAQKLWDGRYRGQRQKWIALKFLGQDNDINLTAHAEPEFGQWKWMRLNEVLDSVVPFKLAVYERVIKEFSPLSNVIPSVREGYS